MILDSLINSASVEQMHPLFQKAFDFLRTTDFSNMAPGKIEIDGEKLFVSIAETEGKTKDAAKLETHNKYIDIQMPIEGTETMGWLTGKNCVNEVEPYDTEKDITFFTDKPSAYIQVQPYEFVIFFPEDGHAPLIAEGTIKKVVVKVLI